MKRVLATLCVGLGLTSYAQEFEISTEIRPRFEYRHGYKTLVVDSLKAGIFVSQRTRLNVGYINEQLNVYVSLQNVRIWGDVGTLALSDKNGTAIHQAWAELVLDPKFSIKIGRQEIAYDDHRIFGNVDWAQQARSHDAFVATFKPNSSNRLDVGLALNENAETIFESDYMINGYKAFQYLWYHTSFNELGLSVLVLNNGLAFDDKGEQKVDYNQTIGSRITFGENRFSADAFVYFQTGKIADRDLSAYNVAANINYGFTYNLNVGVGVEYISGTDINATNNKLKSFNPWFGTNHKFNGLMDYFYVANHINSVGLLDVNATIAFQKNEFSAKLIPHLFSAAAKVFDSFGDEMSNKLGTELDLVLGYQWTKEVNFQAGYSQVFATNTMEVLKSGNNDNTNNWAWLMVTIKPSLFKTTFKNNQ